MHCPLFYKKALESCENPNVIRICKSLLFINSTAVNLDVDLPLIRIFGRESICFSHDVQANQTNAQDSFFHDVFNILTETVHLQMEIHNKNDRLVRFYLFHKR